MPRVAKVAPAGWAHVRSALQELAAEERRADPSHGSLAALARTHEMPPLTRDPVHHVHASPAPSAASTPRPASVARHRSFVKTIEKEASKRREAYDATRRHMLASTPSKTARRRIEADLKQAAAVAERETLATLAHAQTRHCSACWTE